MKTVKNGFLALIISCITVVMASINLVVTIQNDGNTLLSSIVLLLTIVLLVVFFLQWNKKRVKK